MPTPDYNGGSIVNLMSAIVAARGGTCSEYPPARLVDSSMLEGARNLVLFVIDGLGHQYLCRHPDSALHRYLRGELTSVFPSTTASAITTFLTGLAPQQHALTGWFMHFAEIERVAAVLPFQTRGDEVSLAALGVDAGRLFGHAPVFDRLATESYVIVPDRIAHSHFNRAHCGRASIRGYRNLDQFFATVSAALGESDAPKYVYAYWADLDRLAHEFGIASAKVERHFWRVDEAFERFVDRLDGGDVVVVTGDHGLIDSTGKHRIELVDHPELAETLALPLCGEPRVAYCYVRPDRRAQFERYVQAELRHCASCLRSEQLIEQGYFGFGPAHPALTRRIGDYVLLMKDHYTIKDRVAGEGPRTQIGTHGGTTREEMLVPLVVVHV